MPKYSDNIDKYQKMLKNVHGGVSIASAETVNEAADIVEKAYKSELQKFTLRNKFTMGAVRKYHAKPQSASGDFRAIQNINAKVGVLKMKGGKDHYLLKQEEGGTRKGSLDTAGKIAFAMDTARTSNKRDKVIKGALQLQKSGRVQTFQFNNGRKIGTKKDGFGDAQRWAILYKYTGLSGRGKQNANNMYAWDAKKPFYFVGMVRGLGIFQAVGRRIKMLRVLNKTSSRIKATGKFEKSFRQIDKNKLGDIMERNAKKIAGVK